MSLTRYLYDRRYVEQSLLASIINHDRDQARFWVYELYHSGFREQTIHLLIEYYYRLYVNRYPNLADFINSLLTDWNDDDDRVVGSIVENYIVRSPDVDLYNSDDEWTLRLKEVTNVEDGYKVLDDYCGSTELRDSLPEETNPSSMELFQFVCISRMKRTKIYDDKRVFIVVTEADIAQYRNRPFVRGKSWKIPRRACLYPICDLTFPEGVCFPDDNWITNAYGTPLWRKRIQKYGGKYVGGKVVFPSEEAEAEFRDWYDMEPDEQSNEVKLCWRGLREPSMKAL
jgi:hypothetical protein